MHSRLPLSYNGKLKTKGQSNKQVENQPSHIGAIQFSCWRWPIYNTQPTRQAQLPNLRKLLEELVPSLQNKNKKHRSSWSILYLKYVHNVSNLKLLVNHYQRLKKSRKGPWQATKIACLQWQGKGLNLWGYLMLNDHTFLMFSDFVYSVCWKLAGWEGVKYIPGHHRYKGHKN